MILRNTVVSKKCTWPQPLYRKKDRTKWHQRPALTKFFPWSHFLGFYEVKWNYPPYPCIAIHVIHWQEGFISVVETLLTWFRRQSKRSRWVVIWLLTSMWGWCRLYYCLWQVVLCLVSLLGHCVSPLYWISPPRFPDHSCTSRLLLSITFCLLFCPAVVPSSHCSSVLCLQKVPLPLCPVLVPVWPPSLSQFIHTPPLPPALRSAFVSPQFQLFGMVLVKLLE